MNKVINDLTHGLREQGFKPKGIGKFESSNYKVRVHEGPLGPYILVADKDTGEDVQRLSGLLKNKERSVNRVPVLLNRIKKESAKKKPRLKDFL